jgi:hypothetical protein
LRNESSELSARFGVEEFRLAGVTNRSLEVLSFQRGACQLVSLAMGEGKIPSTFLPWFELGLR